MKSLFTISAILFFSCASAQTPALVWAKNMGGSSSSGSSVAVDASGNVYTTGTLGGTADFDPGAGIYNLTSAGFFDIFISKLDASGNFVWAKAISGPEYDWGSSIALDDIGNVYVTGQFASTADFDPGPGIHNLTSAGYADIFVLKLTSAGDFVWARQIGGANYDAAYSVAVDSFGNVYTTGSFQSTADFDPGPRTYNLTRPDNGETSTFISKLDASGNFVWAKQLGNGNSYGIRLKVDKKGNIYTTGSFSSCNDFDSGPAVYNLNTHGLNDIFISRLDGSGNFVWARGIGGINNDITQAITIDDAGNIYTTGTIFGTADFDPGPGTYNLDVSLNSLVPGMFVSKLDSSGNFAWAKTMGGQDRAGGASIATDAAGNVYTTGDFIGTADFNPGAGTFLLSANSRNAFVSKLNTSGNFVFAVSMGNSRAWPPIDQSTGNSLVLDSSANIYITGSFKGIADFNPTPGHPINLNSQTGKIFVVKLSQKSNYSTFYKDADGDGYGDPAYSKIACARPAGYVLDNTDCNDNNKAIHKPVTYYRDSDNDGFGDSFNSRAFCSDVAPSGWSTNNYDCYDSASTSHPEYVRVRMCHDGWTQCVNASEIPEKLALGWTMGPCSLQTCAADETLLCHNGRQECVKSVDVPKYLAMSDWWAGPYCSGTPISRTGVSIAGKLARPVIETTLPASLKISNYPNPFSGKTIIRYELPSDSKVSIKVYDQVGRQVATLIDEHKKAGIYTVTFNALQLASGSLFYRLTANSKDQHFQQTGQMIKMK